MAKVTVKHSFIGTPEEVEKYGGQVPKSMAKLEKRMTAAERASYHGKINPDTVMEVDDKRKQELLAAGLIEGTDKEVAAAKEKVEGAQAKEKNVITTNVKEKADEKVLVGKAKKK